MKKNVLFLIGLTLTAICATAQNTLSDRLAKAYAIFEKDSQLKYAISSLYIINANTGRVIFDKNSRVGLAPASTQKVITGATAFELLGKDYCFKTTWGYQGTLTNGGLHGNLIVTGHGDPTLGSKRFETTRASVILSKWTSLLKQQNISHIEGSILNDTRHWESQSIPNAWIWEDIGNYFGAGASSLNWLENQYDVVLRSGPAAGDPVRVVRTVPELPSVRLISELTSGPKGSGDKAFIYLPPQASVGYIRGSIPLGESSFTISGSLPDPGKTLIQQFKNTLRSAGISISETKNETGFSDTSYSTLPLFISYSPALDSINYWFLQKSINLYGEALLKAIAFEKTGRGSTGVGIKLLKDRWKQEGLDENELNIFDGSGLSPQNRITTHAQAAILKHARQQSWFPLYFSGFPVYNGIKMKSGTIRDVKGFCGYHTSKSGEEYIFSFLVNNYNGSPASLVRKMYTVLNELK